MDGRWSVVDGRRGPFGQDSGGVSRQAERSLSWSGQSEIPRFLGCGGPHRGPGPDFAEFTTTEMKKILRLRLRMTGEGLRMTGEGTRMTTNGLRMTAKGNVGGDKNGRSRRTIPRVTHFTASVIDSARSEDESICGLRGFSLARSPDRVN